MVYRMDQMSWSEFDQRRKETDTIIVPTGACEIMVLIFRWEQTQSLLWQFLRESQREREH